MVVEALLIAIPFFLENILNELVLPVFMNIEAEVSAVPAALKVNVDLQTTDSNVAPPEDKIL